MTCYKLYVGHFLNVKLGMNYRHRLIQNSKSYQIKILIQNIPHYGVYYIHLHLENEYISYQPFWNDF